MKKDILLWKGLLIEGGVISFHDYNMEGINRAIEELIIRPGGFIEEGIVGLSRFFSKGVTRNKDIFDEVRLFNNLKNFLRPWKKRK